jgi:hypothetical protein
MSQQDNAMILAQLAILGTEKNRFEDFLAEPERSLKLLAGLHQFDPSATGFKHEFVFNAAEGLRFITEALLAHLIEKYRDQPRVKNLGPGGNLLLTLRSGAINDRKTLNRIIAVFYDEWPYAAHWRRDLYRIPAGGLTVTALIFGGLQKLRDMMDEQAGLA